VCNDDVSPVPLTGADQVVMNHGGWYYGFTIKETAGSTADVVVYDNASTNTGTILEQISLGPKESAREFYPGSIRVSNGVYVDVVSGAVAGSIRVG